MEDRIKLAATIIGFITAILGVISLWLRKEKQEEEIEKAFKDLILEINHNLDSLREFRRETRRYRLVGESPELVRMPYWDKDASKSVKLVLSENEKEKVYDFYRKLDKVSDIYAELSGLRAKMTPQEYEEKVLRKILIAPLLTEPRRFDILKTLEGDQRKVASLVAELTETIEEIIDKGNPLKLR